MNTRFFALALLVGAAATSRDLSAQASPRKPTSQTSSPRQSGTTPKAPAATPVAAAPAEAPVVKATPAPAAEPTSASEKRGDAAPAGGAKGEHVRFGLQAGLAAPMSSLGKAFSAGYTAGGFLTGRPEGFPVSLRGDLQYTHFGGKNKVVTPSYSVIQITGAGVYDFPKSGGGKSPFFASAGLGLYRWSANNESQTDFGQNLGLGFNLRKYRFQPFVEGRFHFFNDVQYFTLTAAAHF